MTELVNLGPCKKSCFSSLPLLIFSLQLSLQFPSLPPCAPFRLSLTHPLPSPPSLPRNTSFQFTLCPPPLLPPMPLAKATRGPGADSLVGTRPSHKQQIKFSSHTSCTAHVRIPWLSCQTHKLTTRALTQRNQDTRGLSKSAPSCVHPSRPPFNAIRRHERSHAKNTIAVSCEKNCHDSRLSQPQPQMLQPSARLASMRFTSCAHSTRKRSSSSRPDSTRSRHPGPPYISAMCSCCQRRNCCCCSWTDASMLLSCHLSVRSSLVRGFGQRWCCRATCLRGTLTHRIFRGWVHR